MTNFKIGLTKYLYLFEKVVFSYNKSDQISLNLSSNLKDEGEPINDIIAIPLTLNDSNNQILNVRKSEIEDLDKKSETATELSEFIQDINLGEIIPVRCGHAGLFDIQEMDALKVHLFKANFLTDE